MKGTGAFLLTLSLSAGIAQAQQDSTTRVLDEVVVTANRFAQKQSSTGKVLTVINRTTIERSLGMSVAELLNQQAGIAIAGANNNMGTNPDVYMRGAATGNTLILMDGVPMYDVATINIDEGWVEISAADLAENNEHTYEQIQQGIGNPTNMDRAKLNRWLTFQITGEAPEDMDEDMEDIFPVLRFSFTEAANLFGNPEGPSLPS